jgi:hypothetical protein
VFRVGLFFVRLAPICWGAVASQFPRGYGGAQPPFQRRQPHLLNLSPNWIANWVAAAFQVIAQSVSTARQLRRCGLKHYPCVSSHAEDIDRVVLDTEQWERSATFTLEASENVVLYARNDHLGFGIPYEFYGVPHTFQPDFLVRLKNGVTLVLEIKGMVSDQDEAKAEAAKRWFAAVNNWRPHGTMAVPDVPRPAGAHEAISPFRSRQWSDAASLAVMRSRSRQRGSACCGIGPQVSLDGRRNRYPGEPPLNLLRRSTNSLFAPTSTFSGKSHPRQSQGLFDCLGNRYVARVQRARDFCHAVRFLFDSRRMPVCFHQQDR